MKKTLLLIASILGFSGVIHADLISGTQSGGTFNGVFTGGVFLSSTTGGGSSGLVSANYSMRTTDSVIFASAPLAGITITLNASTGSVSGGSSQVIQITKVDTSTSAVKIKALGTDLIGGTTGLITLNALGQTAELIADGNGNWFPHGQGIQLTPLRVYANTYGAYSTFSAATSSNIYVCPFYTSVPISVVGYAYEVIGSGGAGATLSFGVLDINGNVLTSTGPVNVPGGTGNETVTSAGFNLAPGAYYIASQITFGTGGSAQIAGAGVGGATHNGCELFTESTKGISAVTFPGTNSGPIPLVTIVPAGGRQGFL